MENKHLFLTLFQTKHKSCTELFSRYATELLNMHRLHILSSPLSRMHYIYKHVLIS